MTKEELTKRVHQIVEQDQAAKEIPRDNLFTQGYIEGHLAAFVAIKKLLEALS